MSGRALVSDLPKGHEFPATTFTLTADGVARYLEAVGDTNAVYAERGLAPPLAVAAQALGALLAVLELPAGTLHTGQEIDSHGGVPLDTELTLTGRVAQRSERAGMVICAIEFQVTPSAASEAALSGRTTLMIVGGAS